MLWQKAKHNVEMVINWFLFYYFCVNKENILFSSNNTIDFMAILTKHLVTNWFSVTGPSVHSEWVDFGSNIRKIVLQYYRPFQKLYAFISKCSMYSSRLHTSSITMICHQKPRIMKLTKYKNKIIRLMHKTTWTLLQLSFLWV